MGYLSNKKHKARVNTILKTSIFLLAMATFLGFGSNVFSHFFAQYRWQFFLVLLIIFIYSLLRRSWGYMFLAFVLGIINYFTVSSVVNIINFTEKTASSPRLLFVSKATDPFEVIEFAENKKSNIIAVMSPQMNDFDLRTMLSEKYAFLHSSEGWDNGFMLSNLPVSVSGRIKLDENLHADFAKVQFNNMPIVFIAVDFSGMRKSQYAKVLESLSTFCAKHDDPVVVFGDFNTVAWSKELNDFINKNGFTVKNALLNNWRNVIIPQHYYILGYEKNYIDGDIMLSGANYFSMFTRF